MNLKNTNFLFPLIGVSSGIFLASEVVPSLILGIIALILALMVWLLIYFKSKNPSVGLLYSPLHILWVTLLFMSLGALDYHFRSLPQCDNLQPGKEYWFTGEVKKGEALNSGDRYEIKVNKIQEVEGNIIPVKNLNIILKTDGFIAGKGDIIKFQAVPVNVADINKNNYADRLRHKGIIYYTNAKSKDIEIIKHGNAVFSLADNLRSHLIILLEKSSLDRNTSEFIISILLGEKSFLSSEQQNALNSAGMAHVLALSGMHVGIILYITLLLLFPLSLFGKYKTRSLLAILILWGYVLLTGGSPSTVRAALMATFVMMAFLLERKNSALNSLMAAVMIILLVEPLDLWDIGLQLSFLCVAAILIFTERLNPIDHKTHPGLYKTFNAILVTLIATFTTWIIIAYYFGNVPVAFVLSNFVLLPLLPFFMAGSIMYLICLIFHQDPNVLSNSLNHFHDFFVNTASYLSFHDSAVIKINPPLASVFIWLVGILLFSLYILNKRNKLKFLYLNSAIVFCAISLVTLFFTENKEFRNSVSFPHSFTKMEAKIAKGEESYNYEFSRRSLSNLSHPICCIHAIDNVFKEDSLNLYSCKNEQPCFLYIGPEADNSQMAYLISHNDFRKVVLHAGVGKNKKAELLSLLDVSLWNKIVSLREDGTFIEEI